MASPDPVTATPAGASRRHTDAAIELMIGFAERTGLASNRPPERYLWTDAFAVCNFLGLATATGESRFADLALKLIDQVHRILGRHRPGDLRVGWISGLEEDAARIHPTQGGLRIGKKLPERGPDEAFDADLEWERDGQYFHYLTRWMHALDQASRAIGEPRFNRWARELARTACAAFIVRPPGGAPRLAWKMSVDLSRPLVPSMGQHDPLDGFITCMELQATASGLPGCTNGDEGPDLKREAAVLSSMLAPGDWLTADPLGIGGLLTDACRVSQLGARGARIDPGWLPALLAAALAGLRHYRRQGDLARPASSRLAFRELGLAIGLGAVGRMGREARVEPGRATGGSDIRALLDEFNPYVAFGQEIESCWRRPGSRKERAWLAHRDINDVMLATSLVPDGFTTLFPAGQARSPS